MSAVASLLGANPTMAEILVHARRPFAPAVVQPKLERQGADWGDVVFFVDVRAVIDRLNLLLPGRWHADLDVVDHSPPPAAGTDPALVYRCRLTAGDSIHTDVGEGFDHKAARSDALKRAAIHLGIGHCLWRIEPIRMHPGPGRHQLCGDAPEFTLDAANRRWLRARYQAWLTRAGIAEFGLPLDHGVAARALVPDLFPDRPSRAPARRSPGPATRAAAPEPTAPASADTAQRRLQPVASASIAPASTTPVVPTLPAAAGRPSGSNPSSVPAAPTGRTTPASPIPTQTASPPPPATPAPPAPPAAATEPATRLTIVQTPVPAAPPDGRGAGLVPARHLVAVPEPAGGTTPPTAAAKTTADPATAPAAPPVPARPAAPEQRAALLEIANRLGYGVLTVEALATCVYAVALDELGEEALHGVRSYLESAAAGRIAEVDLAARIAQGARESTADQPARDRLARWLLAHEERAAADPA